MTPTQWIEQMGAGWNLGNTYEYYLIKTPENEKWRYWCARGNWTYEVQHNGESLNTGNIAPLSRGAATEVTITFTAPTEGNIDVVLVHPVIETSVTDMTFTITTMKVGETTVIPIEDELTFPAFSNFESTLSNVDLSTITSEVTAGQKISMTLLVDRESLPQYPTNDETVLSDIRTYYNTASRAAGGTPAVTEAQAKAVATVGFKSVRIPITWLSHFDVVDDNGNVKVDEEFLDHIAEIIGYFHKYGLSVVINMHHDDQQWLKTGLYITDPTRSVRYKSIWTQVADYFKDYGDWLAFASNNETRNDAGTWEGAGVKNTDIYGLMQIQKDFYDVVRNSGGNNATRICMYPTYAAKTGYLTASYKNPNDESETGKWGFPYNDAYGIAEIHPYAGNIDSVQSLNKTARNSGFPIIYGEFGTSAENYNNFTQCQVHTYTVAYAAYHGMGTYIWDDYGGMQILKRNLCTMNNSDQFDKLWRGYPFDFVPMLVACSHPKLGEILLSNRRNDCYTADEVTINIDSLWDSIISDELGTSPVKLNGHSFIAGSEDIHGLLAISYDGYYNTIDVEVNRPEHWIETTYGSTAEWTHDWPNTPPYQRGTKMIDNRFWSIEIPITVPSSEVRINNTTYTGNGNRMAVIQYKGNRINHLDDKTYPYVDYVYENEVLQLEPECKYIVVGFVATKASDMPREIASDTWIKVSARDYSQVEENDRTDDYVDSIVEYDNYNVSICRTIDAGGGVEYTADFGSIECNVYIREFNGEKLEAEYWIENGDTFTTNLFTKSMRIEIEVPNANINAVITAMNNGVLRPTLAYTDYATHQSEYNEEFTPIPIADGKKHAVGIGNKLLSFNGKVVEV